MKNITVSIDEQTHRQARIRAAEMGTSVSALVRTYLNRLAAEPLEKMIVNNQESETPLKGQSNLRELLKEWDAKGIGLKMSENLPREALYDRNALR